MMLTVIQSLILFIYLFTHTTTSRTKTVAINVEVIITSEREARSEFLLIYTKNLSMSGRPAVVTLLRGLYLWNHKPD